MRAAWDTGFQEIACYYSSLLYSATSSSASRRSSASGGRGQTAEKQKGLKLFSTKVCEKVRQKGKTTYNEVGTGTDLTSCHFQCNFSAFSGEKRRTWWILVCLSQFGYVRSCRLSKMSAHLHFSGCRWTCARSPGGEARNAWRTSKCCTKKLFAHCLDNLTCVKVVQSVSPLMWAFELRDFYYYMRQLL